MKRHAFFLVPESSQHANFQMFNTITLTKFTTKYNTYNNMVDIRISKNSIIEKIDDFDAWFECIFSDILEKCTTDIIALIDFKETDKGCIIDLDLQGETKRCTLNLYNKDTRILQMTNLPWVIWLLSAKITCLPTAVYITPGSKELQRRHNSKSISPITKHHSMSNHFSLLFLYHLLIFLLYLLIS